MRYAVYFAPPPQSEWWSFGCRWLGRDALSGRPEAQWMVPGVNALRMDEFTRAARRYGFHATLKAPFALAESCTEFDLHGALIAFVATRAPFPLGMLECAVLDGFIALRPRKANAALNDLAADCVKKLDAFRAPPSIEELARRRSATLSPRQELMLARWGYPYVLDEWRFHMTLTERLPPAEQAPLLEALQPEIAKLNATPLWMDALCLFVERAPGEPFRLVRRYAFGGRALDDADDNAIALAGALS